MAADDRISTKNALQFFQGGLNLPEASYYLDQDDKAKKIREAYVAYLIKLFGLIGEGANAQKSAEEVLRLGHKQTGRTERIAAKQAGLAVDTQLRQVVDDFLAYIDGAELIIHNAAFDLGFLDNELSLLGEQYGKITDRCTVIDTLALARERFPGQRNSLDALCRRLGRRC